MQENGLVYGTTLQLTNLTNTADPNDVTSTNYNQWRPIGKSVNMSAAYSWNVTLPWLPTGSSIQAVVHEDVSAG